MDKTPSMLGSALPWLLVWILMPAPSTCTAGINASEMALRQLERQNFLVGIARVGAASAHLGECAKDLKSLLSAVAQREYWSVRVTDSFGNPPRTFAWGNYHWFNSPSHCDELNSPMSISLSGKLELKVDFNVTSPVPLRFTVLFMNFTTPHFINLNLPFEPLIHLGLCLPASCTDADLLRFSTSYFQSRRFEMQQNFDLELTPVGAKSPAFDWFLFTEPSSVLLICIWLLIALLTGAAELAQRTSSRTQAQRDVDETSGKRSATPAAAAVKRLLLCFHVGTNYRLATSGNGNGIDSGKRSARSFLAVISGMRSIVCLWVTVFHAYYYSLFALSNATLVFAKLEHFALQPILQACFYVDVFFIISAFLLVYNFISNAQQLQQIGANTLGQNLTLWLRTAARRYLRLTPVLIVIMSLSDCVHNLLNATTPFRLGAHSGIYCKNTWWHNLLYMQNFLDMGDICCSWSWYLACEMQYFLLFTALLFLYARNAKAAKTLYAALLVGFVAAAWLCNYHNGITFQIDVIYSTLNQLYAKPWVRVIPYFGGSFAAWCLHINEPKLHKHQLQQQQQQQQPQEQQLSSFQHHQSPSSASGSNAVGWRAAFWLLAGSLYVATNFMSYWRSATATVVAAIMSFGKLLFALVAGGAIALCVAGKGGQLAHVLAASVFRKLNKFCFSAYLLAPVIVFASFGLRNEATNFTEVGSANDFLAVVVLSFSAAFLLVLFIEIPTQRLSDVLLNQCV